METERKRSRRVKPQSSLLAWRKEMGFDQDAAAIYLGISQSYYSKLEQGQQTPRPKKAKGIVERTGVPLDVLMGIAS